MVVSHENVKNINTLLTTSFSSITTKQEITKDFFIDDFEQNDDHGKDIIRRFIGFIDIAYIEKVKIKFFMNNDDIQSLYNGEELLFLWDRTISRIEEMRDINDK